MLIKAPEILSTSRVIHADRVALSDLVHKKAALIFFWNGSGVSSLRALRSVGVLHEKYGNLGLEVIGIHTPEFTFEEDYSYVERAVANSHVRFPVVLDNDYENWLSYENRYWPRLYVVNVEGDIIHDQIGEVGWGETERQIRKCLLERALLCGESSPFDHESFAPGSDTHVGPQYSISFGSRSRPSGSSHHVELVGSWTVGREYIESSSSEDSLLLRGLLRDLYLVTSGPRDVRFSITLNSAHPGHHRGEHVDGGASFSGFSGSLLRVLKNLPDGSHLVTCSASGPGLRLYRAVVE